MCKQHGVSSVSAGGVALELGYSRSNAELSVEDEPPTDPVADYEDRFAGSGHVPVDIRKLREA